jgi:hypothetical protein
VQGKEIVMKPMKLVPKEDEKNEKNKDPVWDYIPLVQVHRSRRALALAE